MTPAPFPEFLPEVEKALVAQLGGEAPPRDTLLTAARHLCLGGGKRARPLLVRIFGEALGVDPRQLVVPATAAELIHAASLLHDDVVDSGMFRRGKPTVNSRWGNTVAVMSGDLLLSGALLELARHAPFLVESALAVIAEMTRAAILEVEVRGRLDLPLETLEQIATGKTGSLFGWCGVAAALVKGDRDAAAAFDAFGRRLGVAFQMADDIRDITGADEGKSPHADLQSRSPSLAILLAVKREPRLRARIQEAWGYGALTPEKARELGTAILCSGAIEEAIERMEAAIEASVSALGPYAQSETGAALVGWARQIARGIALQGAA
ncbi:MAG: polyprenyl synthetase family protein [Myxococcaceae bacterium]|nr:polyprenyl synthetase family protein [Myxococcaceae bacterium]